MAGLFEVGASVSCELVPCASCMVVLLFFLVMILKQMSAVNVQTEVAIVFFYVFCLTGPAAGGVGDVGLGAQAEAAEARGGYQSLPALQVRHNSRLPGS